MKGDFSRFTFDPQKHYRSVRMQQGRVQLDADWNEQIDILYHGLETQVIDLLGARGAPDTQPESFAVTLHNEPPGNSSQDETGSANSPPGDFEIGAGHYYVDGILCRNEDTVRFTAQPDYPRFAAQEGLRQPVQAQHYVAYLDVWQRHITAFEDPSLREIALGGPDTTTRTKTIWQAKLLPVDADRARQDWERLAANLNRRGRLAARRQGSGASLDNQLYRVEVHSVNKEEYYFKWSGDNGAIVFPITAIDEVENAVVLSVTGLDEALATGDWVEIVDDDTQLAGRSWPLCLVGAIDRPKSQVTLTIAMASLTAELSARHGDVIQDPMEYMEHALLRRWDANDVKIELDAWVDLIHGVQVRFSQAEPANGGPQYRVGDYWLIPTRTLIGERGGLDWPDGSNQPPAGIDHHYAPLALLQWNEKGWSVQDDWRSQFAPLTSVARNHHATGNELRQALDKIERLEETLANGIAQALDRSVDKTAIYGDYQAASDQMLEPGIVVAVDTERPDAIEPATDRNARRVIGVIAEAIDGPESDKRYRVTLYGPVSCRVVGEVNTGDLLVPSAEPGCAEKSGVYLKPGTIIGKALGSHSARGDQATLIDILVMLG